MTMKMDFVEVGERGKQQKGRSSLEAFPMHSRLLDL